MRPDQIARLRTIVSEGARLLAEIDADNEAPPVERKVAELRGRCRDSGIAWTVNDCVRTADAAKLLGLAPKTLRNNRAYGLEQIPFQRRGKHCEYRLRDLAEHVLATEKDL